MASHGHGIARAQQPRTAEQQQKELDKIKAYRDLDDQVRQNVSSNTYTPATHTLTTALLRLNPEYYTIWNVRRRCLISGLFSKSSASSWPSTESPTLSRTTTTTSSSAAFSSSCSSTTETQPSLDRRKAGKNGTTAETAENSDDVEDSAEASKEVEAVGTAIAKEEEWKKQRQEAETQDLLVLKSELGFTIPLLMEFPKCYWIWKYRLWLLQQVIDRLPLPIARRIWEEELGLVSKMLTRDRRNFHAWGYRRTVVAKLESEVLEGKSMVEAEFEYTTRMIRQDLSNFSAWHNRSKLIPRLLEEKFGDEEGRKGFFDQELNLIKEALNVGPEDQSLWYYHQYLMLDLVTLDTSPTNTTPTTITRSLTLEQRISYLAQEMQDTQELLEDYDDCKLIYEALIDYRIALCRLQQRPPDSGERREMEGWLGRLRELDGMRKGRWDDLARDEAFSEGDASS